VVTPLSVVDLPESYKDALADVTGAFRVSFQPFYCAWKLSGRFSNQQHLTGGLPISKSQGKTMPQRRLIEEAFPLQKVSEDSKHEKNVRHGHISTLHIWPARRPLAACRAAIIAALMPDPGNEQSRAELCKKIESITHWGSENGPALDFFRREIRKALVGRAPRVLDMFAGGGAFPWRRCAWAATW
jgi:hypothetical protein